MDLLSTRPAAKLSADSTFTLHCQRYPLIRECPLSPREGTVQRSLRTVRCAASGLPVSAVIQHRTECLTHRPRP